ncbi:hypothetical protein LTR66_009967, partial [Elasticomyces elasticus]
MTIDSTLYMSTPASLSASISSDPKFILTINHFNSELHNRRQSGGSYIGANGVITNDCSDVPVYGLSSTGELSATINGTSYYFSTNPGVQYTPFIPSVNPGPINKTFSIGSSLFWGNNAFYNGQASFCAFSNGSIYAVFVENAQPSGCFFIQVLMSE